jgi:hypothetical protein
VPSKTTHNPTVAATMMPYNCVEDRLSTWEIMASSLMPIVGIVPTAAIVNVHVEVKVASCRLCNNQKTMDGMRKINAEAHHATRERYSTSKELLRRRRRR